MNYTCEFNNLELENSENSEFNMLNYGLIKILDPNNNLKCN